MTARGVDCVLYRRAADAYANDCFPRYPGEVSGLLNLFRTLGGFAMPYFQTAWARKNGALQVFGCEAACVLTFSVCAGAGGVLTGFLRGRIVAGMFFMIVPAVYLLGPKLRVSVPRSSLGKS